MIHSCDKTCIYMYVCMYVYIQCMYIYIYICMCVCAWFNELKSKTIVLEL